MKTDRTPRENAAREAPWESTVRGELFDELDRVRIAPANSAVARDPQEREAMRSGLLEDMAIALGARNVLQWTTYLPKDTFSVRVEKGWLTLSGEVDWEYQRHAALRVVCNLQGVTGVSDQVTIKPAVSLSSVRSSIEAAILRRAKDQP